MTGRIAFIAIVVSVPLLQMRQGWADEPQKTVLTYASVNGTDLKLDLYQTKSSITAPVVIWIHGGAWRSGSRARVPVLKLVDRGFNVASVDYRLSGVARFPAQSHDIKAAIRFLRANAAKYNLDANQFSIAGASAGGHLAALVGVSTGVESLEGRIGKHLDESSQVGAIVSFYGASNLRTILSQSTPHGLSVRVPALDLLLGGQPDEKVELARLASPVTHVDSKDPRLLLIHGDQDPQMPINQSHELVGEYRKVKASVALDVVYGAAHGGKEFYTPQVLDQVAEFLSQ